MMNAIIAVNPQQMQEAQATTTGWIGAKLDDARSDLSIAQATFDQLEKAKLRTAPAKAMIAKANRRIRFYEKVKAALEAGYYIIPPFDIQLFAIRTESAAPPLQKSDGLWSRREMEASAVPLGKGRYVNANPVVSKVDTEQRPYPNDPAKTREVTIYGNTRWQHEIDMPIRAMKPEVIEATGRALALRIFDALGIAPAYRAADPIIAGQIKRPDGKGVLTFFVAWWLDESDL